LAYLDLLNRTIGAYDVVVANVTTEVNRFQNRITAPAAMGFNLFAELGKLRNGDYKTLVASLSTLENTDVLNDYLKEHVIIAASSKEITLQQKLEDLNLSRSISPSIVQKYLTRLNNFYVAMRPLPSDYSPIFEKFFMDPVSDAHLRLMDLRTPYRTMVYATVRGMVANTLKYKTAPQGKTFLDLLATLEIQMNRFALKNTVAARISEGRVAYFFVDMITTVLLSRWFKMDYQIDMNRFDLATLCECIILKLITPKRIWGDETITRIDNYIAVHLVMRLSTYNGSLSSSSAMNTNENILAKTLANMPEMAAFLVTTGKGDGWSGGGVTPSKKVIRAADDAPFFPYSFVGEPVYGGGPSEADPPFVQMDRFSAMVTYLTQGRAREGEKRTSAIQYRPVGIVDLSSLVKLLDNIAQRSWDMGEFARRTDEFVRSASWIPICGQTSDDDPDAQLSWVSNPVSYGETAGMNAATIATFVNDGIKTIIRSTVEVSPGDAVALPFSMEPATVAEFGSQIPNVFKGWSWFQKLHEITGNYAVGDRYLPRPYFNRSDRIKWALDASSNFLAPYLREALVDTKVFIMPMEGSSYRMKQFEFAADFIRDQEHLHGFVKSVVFNAKMAPPPSFAKLLTSCSPSGLPPHTVEDFIKSYEKDELTALTMDANMQSKELHFAIPTPVTFELATPANFGQIPFSVVNGVLTVSPLSQMYIWADDTLRSIRETNAFAFVRTPAFMTSSHPFRQVEPSDLLGLVSLVPKLKKLSFFGQSGDKNRQFTLELRV
jgi:hypothetical protein